jgi:multisubunit Na+/H+ antiporter MnhC subunit
MASMIPDNRRLARPDWYLNVFGLAVAGAVLAMHGDRPMNCQGILNSCLSRQPGWPLLEALVITAAVLLVSVLAVELGAAMAACSPF